MNRKLLTLLVPAVVQPMIPNAPSSQPGQCHALVNVPAKLISRTQDVLAKEAGEELEIVPAKYEWVEKQIVVSAEEKSIELIPATYKTIKEEIVVEPERKDYEVIPAKYEKVTEKVMVKPAMRVWKKSASGAVSLAGEVMRLIERPAEYTTITRMKMVAAPQVREIVVPAKIDYIEKKVIDTPATTREIIIPAQFKTVRVRQLVEEPKPIRKPIPATTQKVTTNEVVQPAQLKWQRVPCDKDLNEKNIIAIQKGLKAAGYQVTADGKFGKGSLEALEKFQEARNLAKGAITIETMRALGINIK